MMNNPTSKLKRNMPSFTAKAQAVVEIGGPLQVVETEIPPLKGTEVLVKNTYAGMCHSDLHLWEGKHHFGVP